MKLFLYELIFLFHLVAERLVTQLTHCSMPTPLCNSDSLTLQKILQSIYKTTVNSWFFFYLAYHKETEETATFNKVSPLAPLKSLTGLFV